MKKALHRNWRRHVGLLIIVAMLTLITSQTANSIIPARAASHRTQPKYQVIPEHVIPEFLHSHIIRPTAPGNILHLAVSLKLRNQESLKALLAEQYLPHSPFYQQYLTPRQFTRQFDPTPTTVNKVVSFLSSQGFTINAITPNSLIIDATSTVALTEKAFKITINDYPYTNRTIYAPANNPSVPANIADAIQCIAGLNNIPWIDHTSVSKHLKPLLGPGGGYTPTELRTAYNATSLLSAGYKEWSNDRHLRARRLSALRYQHLLEHL